MDRSEFLRYVVIGSGIAVGFAVVGAVAGLARKVV